MSKKEQVNINGKSYRRLSDNEIDVEIERFKFPTTHRIVHPSDLCCYLLTYFYKFEIINLPAESLNIDDLISFFDSTLREAVERRSSSGDSMEFTPGMDLTVRIGLILHHVKNLGLIAHNSLKDNAGVKMAHTSYFITAGGMYDGKIKELVMMAPGKEGIFTCKWGDGYSKNGETKLVRGYVYTDLVVVSEQERRLLGEKGIKEFNLFECIISGNEGSKRQKTEKRPELNRVTSLWPWKRH